MKRQIPFVGGELTRAEEIRSLKEKDYSDADIAFSVMVGGFSQSFRSGEMRGLSLDDLQAAYLQVAQILRLPQEDGGWAMAAPSLDEFREQYKALYGVDIVGDSGFPLRIDIGDQTRHGQQGRDAMLMSDRHLLGLIEQQLTERHTVLVVYGGSHWSTLSAALEKRLGKPAVAPFLK